MKANVGCNTIALLLLVACNRPETDLFGTSASGPDQNGPDSGGSMAVAGSKGTGADMNGGTSGASPATGGGTPTAGSSAEGGSSSGSGGSMPLDMSGAAGAPDGTGGSTQPPQPTDPVCGNGILEAGEECDDSAHAGDDGCDAACKVVCADYGAEIIESDDHHCYGGFDQADFKNAQAACVKRGAHLASISSEAENKLARSLVNNSKWLGGFEDVTLTTQGVGDYQWVTGEPFSYTNWADHEPNGGRVRCLEFADPPCYEHCISMLGDGTWADQRCDMADGYVCEWEPAGTKK